MDHCRWGNPEVRNIRMVDKIKQEIETLGFQQIVEGITRTWSGQPDSLLDHIWLNNMDRIIYKRNIVRSFSDHNLLLISLRTQK